MREPYWGDAERGEVLMLGDDGLAILASWGRVFLATGLAVLLSQLVAGGWAAVDVQAIGLAAIVALLPVVINWLNPRDTRYGRGAPK